MNKRIVIPIVILLITLILGGIFFIKGKSPNIKIPDTNQEFTEEIKQPEDKDKARVILSATSDGKLYLYDIESREKKFELDLVENYFKEEILDSVEDLTPKDSIESVEPITVDNEELISVPQELDSEGSIKMNTDDSFEEVDVDEVISELDSADSTLDNQSISNNEDGEINKSKTRTFKYFKNQFNDDYIAHEISSNNFYSISIKENSIYSTILLENFEIQNVKGIWAEESIIYMTSESNELLKIAKKEITQNSSNLVEKIELKGNPSSFLIYEDCLYYSYGDRLEKINLINQKSTDILLGDYSNEIFINNNKLYSLNNFGEGMSNSVLLKINPLDMKVENIMELMGKNSKLISVDDDILYVRQDSLSKNIKSINLKTFKPQFSMTVEIARNYLGFKDLFIYQNNKEAVIYSMKENKTVKGIFINGDIIGVLK